MDKAKEYAKQYLKKSIDSLQLILGVDAYALTEIPVDKSSQMYDSYYCLMHEVDAYRKLLDNE
jgi:hypothetical protein